MTLEQIIATQTKKRVEEGQFGITACKETIKANKEALNYSYYQQLEYFVERANNDVFFNKQMVLACWELINGK